MNQLNNREIIRKYYLKFLNREPDVEGWNHYVHLMETKEIDESKLVDIFQNSVEYKLIEKNTKEFNVNFFEKKIYSQNGEDGILDFIFRIIGTTNKFCIEIGVGDGTESNTRLLLENNWNGLLLDKINPDTYTFQLNYPTANKQLETKYFQRPSNLLKYIKNEFITTENVNNILSKYHVPNVPDLLSLDVDYNTYWIWKSINTISPRVVVVEYNSHFLPTESKSVLYFPYAEWDWTNYYGASLLAYVKLGHSFGYELVGCDSSGINAFFIRDTIIKQKNIPIKNIHQLYKPPQFGDVWEGIAKGWPISNKEMIDV